MSVGLWGIESGRVIAAIRSDRSALAIEAGSPSVVALAAIVPILATLAACAPSPFVQNRTQFTAPTAIRQAALDLRAVPSSNIARHSVVRKISIAKKPDATTPAVLNARPAAKGNSSSDGVASFYTEDEWTASGEKFNTHAMTAAHPTLPFGTRLRVTNVTNGRSVVVRINDRGPYIPGRVVDLSESAAESLRMVERGIVKVKLEVVQKSPGATTSTK
jgi:rare lipoprotein A